MPQLTVRRHLDSPPEPVWQSLRDFGGISRWNPNLKASHLLEGSPACGLGATRHCDLADGKNYIRERIIAWEEGRSYTVDIYDGTMPLQSAQATLSVATDSSAQTVVTMQLDYVPRWGVFGRLLDVLLLGRMLRSQCEQVLAGLAAHSGASRNPVA